MKRRKTVSERTSPISQCNGCKVTEKWKVVIEIVKKTKHSC